MRKHKSCKNFKAENVKEIIKVLSLESLASTSFYFTIFSVAGQRNWLLSVTRDARLLTPLRLVEKLFLAIRVDFVHLGLVYGRHNQRGSFSRSLILTQRIVVFDKLCACYVVAFDKCSCYSGLSYNSIDSAVFILLNEFKWSLLRKIVICADCVSRVWCVVTSNVSMIVHEWFHKFQNGL